MTFIISLIFGVLAPFLLPISMSFVEEDSAVDDRMDETVSTITRYTQNSQRVNSTTPKRRTFRESIELGWKRIGYFYWAPVTCFSYKMISLLAFLSLFVYNLLFDQSQQEGKMGITNQVLILWVLTHFIETVRQAIRLNRSFRDYLGRLWKAIDFAAVFFFVIGSVLQAMLRSEHHGSTLVVPIISVEMAHAALVRLINIIYALSFFFFCLTILEAYSVSIRIGTLVIMIQTMVINNLLPFLAVFMVVLLSFSVLQWVAAFTSTASPIRAINFATLFKAVELAYYQIFGEYNLESFAQSSDQCTTDGINCPDVVSAWLAPVLLAIFVVFTQILALNVLIAMLTNTFEKIEADCAGYWALQSYETVVEYSESSPFPPPFSLLWHIYLLIELILLQFCKKKSRKRRGESKVTKEGLDSQSTKWERSTYKDFVQVALRGKERNQDSRKVYSTKATIINTGGQATSDIATLKEFAKKYTTISKEMEKLRKSVTGVETKLDQLADLILRRSGS